MPITLTPTQSNIQTALRRFLVDILPSGIEIIEGQDNRVAEPKGGNFVVMTAIRRRRISTNVDTIPTISSQAFLQATEVTFQLDVHGPNSANNAQVISTLMRDEYAVDAFAAFGFPVTPLHADDPRQMPFMNAENQYETRWIVEVLLQANQTVTASQETAEAVEVTTVNVETYP